MRAAISKHSNENAKETFRRVETSLSPIQSYASEGTYNESFDGDTRDSISDCSDGTFESRKTKMNKFSHFEHLMRSKKGKQDDPTSISKTHDEKLKSKTTGSGKLSYVDRLLKKRDEDRNNERKHNKERFSDIDEFKPTKSTDLENIGGRKQTYLHRFMSMKKDSRSEYSCLDDPSTADHSYFEERQPQSTSGRLRRGRDEDYERGRARERAGESTDESSIAERERKNALRKVSRGKKKDGVNGEFIYASIEEDELSFDAGTISDDEEQMSSDEDTCESNRTGKKKQNTFSKLLRRRKKDTTEETFGESIGNDGQSYDEGSLSIDEDDLSTHDRQYESGSTERKRPNHFRKLLRRKGGKKFRGQSTDESIDEDEQSSDEDYCSIDGDVPSIDESGLSRSLTEDDDTHGNDLSRRNLNLDAVLSEEPLDGPDIKMIVLKPDDPVLQRKLVKKQVIVKSIGNATRGQYVIKGKPSVPYQLSSIRPLLSSKEPVSKTRTKPRFHVQSPRNGSVFQRIKPRPVLMDATRRSKSPVTPRKDVANDITSPTGNNTSFHYNPKSRALESLRSRRSKSQSRGLWGKNEVRVQGRQEGKEEFLTSPTTEKKTGEINSRGLTGIENRSNTLHELPSTDGDSMDVQLEAGNGEVFGDENVPKNDQEVRVLSKAWRRTKEEKPKIDQREEIDNVEVTYNDPGFVPDITKHIPGRIFARNAKKESVTTSVQDYVKVIVQTDKIDQEASGHEPLQEEKTKGNKGIFKGKIKSLRKKYLKAKDSLDEKVTLHLEQSSDEKRKDKFDFCETLESDLITDLHGHLENTKIVYKELGGDSTAMMTVVKEYEDLVPDRDSANVLIQIEASTVSKIDANIRHGHLCIPNGGDLPTTSGIDFVGRVRRCGEIASIRYGINERDRVASLCGYGGNAKYTTMEASKLVRVPLSVPATSASIVVESYLPAFQALHAGVSNVEERHSPNSMKESSVLIFGGISSVGQAMIELAYLFGANKVYSTGLVKHHDLLESLGAIPLGIDTKDWLPSVRDQMDIVIDPYSSEPTDQLRHAIKSGGKIIFFGSETMKSDSGGWFSSLFATSDEGFNEFAFDLFHEWEKNLETSKTDLSYLFGLLKTDKIEPQVARTLKLNKVPDAHFYLDGRRRVQGTFVCIPWAEKQT